jgi:hypothetical protein
METEYTKLQNMILALEEELDYMYKNEHKYINIKLETLPIDRQIDVYKHQVWQLKRNPFSKRCATATIKELDYILYTIPIDINYDDGLFLEIIGDRNDVELIKLFIKHGANVHINNECLLRSSAHSGYIEIVKFLIEQCNADYKVLYKSTAYNNVLCIKQYIDQLDKNRGFKDME